MSDQNQTTVAAGEIALLLLTTTVSRMKGRVEACLERSGSVDAAVTGPGIGISYLFARDIVRACERGEEQIERLRAGVEQMLAHEQAGGDGWWKGWEMLKAAYGRNGEDQICELERIANLPEARRKDAMWKEVGP